jgi:hypothetical protein
MAVKGTVVVEQVEYPVPEVTIKELLDAIP